MISKGKVGLSMVWVLCVVVALSFVAVPKGPSFAVEKWKAGVSLPLLNVFYLPFMRALRQAVEEAGGECIWAEAGGYQVPKELQNVENMVVQGIDVLFIDACDSVASAPAIREANRAGIPVVGLNQRVPDVDMVTVVASDNYGAGKIAAEHLARKLNGKGNILLINGPPVTAVLDRIRAFKDVIEKYPAMRIVGEQMAKNDMADCLYVAENLLSAHPDANGFLCMNDYAFLGAYTALQGLGKEKEVIITSIDALPDVVQLLATGEAGESGTAAQFPIHIARAAIQAYLDHKTGKEVGPFIKVKVEMITEENAAGFHW